MSNNSEWRVARKSGLVLIQSALLITVIGIFASLAVDLGIFETAKTELQRSSDAAALAAGAVLNAGGTVADASAEAITYARANLVTGQQLPITAIDVSFGSYVAGVFTPGTPSPDAVRVVLKRTAATGNPVRLYCSQIIGLYTIDLWAASVVKTRTPPPDYNLVGIDSATFGSLGVLAQIKGRFVSNGPVTIGYPLGLLVGVQGDARSWGDTTKKGALAAISGSVSKLSDQLQYDSVSLPSHNDNANITALLNSSGDLNVIVSAVIPAGTYVVRDLNLLAGVAVRLDGPVTFYVTRSFNIGVAVNLLGNTNFSPANFKIRVAPGGSVNFLAPILVPLNMDLYAPDSAIHIGVGINAFKGRIIGKTLDIMLPVIGTITEDRSLGDALEDAAKLALVR